MDLSAHSVLEENLMSEIWPKKTSDESDPRDDADEEKRREDEIHRDKPPHHD